MSRRRRIYPSSICTTVVWLSVALLSGPKAGSCHDALPESGWSRASCDDDDMLVRRGVPAHEVEEWNRLATIGVLRLLKMWNEGGRKTSSSRVIIAGDSMAGNTYQAIWCAAAKAGCDVRPGNPYEVLTSGGRYEYAPVELEFRNKTARNPVTEAIVQRHRISCPTLGFSVRLVWIKFWWLDEPEVGVGNLNIQTETLLELTKDATFVYANVGHDVSQPGADERVWSVVDTIASIATRLNARQPFLRIASKDLPAPPPRVFVLERPPKHFYGWGNGTGDHVSERHLPVEKRAAAAECTCYQPHHDQSLVFAGNVNTRAEVIYHNTHTPPGGLRLGLIARYYYSFLHEPRCLLHRGSGDCLHFLHHPGIWYPVMDEMVAAASEEPPTNTTKPWRHIDFSRKLSEGD